MSNVRSNNKSSLFLIELIIVILFFAIAGAICVSLFVQSRLLSIQSTELTMATQQCQNAAEALHAAMGDVDAAARLMDWDDAGLDNQFGQSYDLDGVVNPQGRYRLQVTADKIQPNLTQAIITMTDTTDGGLVYSLGTAVCTDVN